MASRGLGGSHGPAPCAGFSRDGKNRWTCAERVSYNLVVVANKRHTNQSEIYTMTKNAIAFDLNATAKSISAADRKNLSAVADGFAQGIKITEEINKALKSFVTRHGWDALRKGSPNPKVAIDSDPAITAARKAKKANPYLRFVWLAVQEAGRNEKTASNVVSIIKKQAQQGLYLGEAKEKGTKVKAKGEPALRVLAIHEPDELTAGIGLADWLKGKSEAYPQLAAFILPALKAYLGDAYEDTEAEIDDEDGEE